MRVDGDAGRTLSYEPNSHGEWQEQPDFSETPMAIDGEAATSNYREDDSDYFSQLRALFQMMKRDEQQRLFENTARALTGVSKPVVERHISNCSKANPAYGAGVAKALKALSKQVG